MTNIRQVINYTLLLLLVIGTSWLSYQTITSNQQNPNANASHTPDAYATDVTALKMNAKGQPHSQLYSPHEVHYPEKDITNFKEPRITFFSQGKEPWHISGHYGQAREKNSIYQIWDHVVMHQAKGANNESTTILSPNITYYPNTNIATTNQHVILLQPGIKLTGIGLKANTKTSAVKLLDKVRGQYEPDQD